MNLSKTIVLVLFVLISFAIFLKIIHVLKQKLKPKDENELNVSASYAVWISSLLITVSVIVLSAVKLMTEATDLIYSNFAASIWKETGKLTSLFLGLSIVWFFAWYFVAGFLVDAVFGKRRDRYELEVNNVSYFLTKGIFTIGLIVCLSPVFEILLRSFIPSIQIPFYR